MIVLDWFKRVGVAIAAIVGALTLHGLVVLPLIMQDVHAAIGSRLEKHAERPHTGSVAVERWDALERRLERIEFLLLNR